MENYITNRIEELSNLHPSINRLTDMVADSSTCSGFDSLLMEVSFYVRSSAPEYFPGDSDIDVDMIGDHNSLVSFDGESFCILYALKYVRDSRQFSNLTEREIFAIETVSSHFTFNDFDDVSICDLEDRIDVALTTINILRS